MITINFGVFGQAQIVLASSDYATEILGDSPDYYYRFGEASGTTATDETGTTDGTYGGSFPPTLGSSGLLTGDSDTAALFGGNGQMVSNVSTYDGSSAISIECWFHSSSYNTSSTNDYILSVPEGSVSNGIDFQINNNTLFVNLVHSGGFSFGDISASLTDNVTYHCVVTYDGTNLRGYLNGSEMSGSPDANSGTLNAAQASIVAGTISGGASAFGFVGTVDEVAVYSSVLSAAQVLSHYNTGTGV